MRMNIFDKPNDQSDARIGSGMARKGRTKSKHKDLQPWLDYFAMLRRHEEQGFLHVKAQEHEAYVTQPALLVLAGVDETEVRQGDIMRDGMRMMRRCTALVRHLRTYAACLAAHAEGLSTFDPRVVYDPTQPLPKIPTGPLTDYLRQPFALNVVQPDEPHDPLYTLLIETRRPWWRLWMPHDHIEVITYDEPKPEEP